MSCKISTILMKYKFYLIKKLIVAYIYIYSIKNI